MWAAEAAAANDDCEATNMFPGMIRPSLEPCYAILRRARFVEGGAFRGGEGRRKRYARAPHAKWPDRRCRSLDVFTEISGAPCRWDLGQPIEVVSRVE